MPIANVSQNLSHLSPLSIKIDRSKRQRTKIDTDDIKPSIAEIGIINPIIVRGVNGEVTLVAGERRLQAAIELGLPTVPCRHFEDLSEIDAQIIETEENIKRKDLPWRDFVRSIGNIHKLHTEQDANWTQGNTAKSLSISPMWVSQILFVYRALDSQKLSQAENWQQAYNILQRLSERRTETVVSDILAAGAKIFGDTLDDSKVVNLSASSGQVNGQHFPSADILDIKPNSPITPTVTVPAAVPKPAEASPIICANFVEWVQSYEGPKFNFIHCDFPYGVYHGGNFGSDSIIDTDKDLYENNPDLFWRLTEALTKNIDRVMSYSAHMMFWFSMNFYAETKSALQRAGLEVQNHPLIWHKSDGRGIAPALNKYPKRTYDTAFLVVRGNRPLVKQMPNSYSAPSPERLIHPSQKSEPMLRVFMAGLVDETTTMLDPTCGSGSALRAAEECGAKSVLGLEYNPEYAKEANIITLKARTMRHVGRML